MQFFALLGLSLVIIAWVFQLLATLKGSRSIQPQFVLFYLIGVIFLIIDGFTTGFNDVAFLNLVCLLVSLTVFIRLISDNETTKANVISVPRKSTSKKKKRKK